MNIDTKVKFDKKILFLFVGALNTLLAFVLFPLAYFFFRDYREHYLLLLAFCQIPCICFSFLTNKYWVFKSKGNVKFEFYKFIIFHLFNFGFSIFLNPIIVNKLKVNPIISQSIINLIIVGISYFWYDKLTFRTITINNFGNSMKRVFFYD